MHRSLETLLQSRPKLQYFSFSGFDFGFQKTKAKKEEEPVRGGSVFAQLGNRLPHGKNPLGECLLRDHKDQSLQGISFPHLFMSVSFVHVAFFFIVIFINAISKEQTNRK